MFIVDSYSLAVIFCVVTMLCWGSWGNTETCRENLALRIVLLGLRNRYPCLLSPFRFHLGSTGDTGRGFVEDLKQTNMEVTIQVLLQEVLYSICPTSFYQLPSLWQGLR